MTIQKKKFSMQGEEILMTKEKRNQAGIDFMTETNS